MKKVNDITICKKDYKTQEEFENAIKRAVMVLLENGYIMTIKYDEPGLGIVWIQYDDADETMGSYYPAWLLPEEYDSIIWDGETDSLEEYEEYCEEDRPTHFCGCGVKLRCVKDNTSHEIVLPDISYTIPHCDCGDITTINLSPELIDELINLLSEMKRRI